MTGRWILLLGLAWSMLASAALAQMRYVYPPPETANDHRLDYYWQLLDAALRVTEGKWGPYVLGPSDSQMNSDRAQFLLSKSDEVTVITRTTSAEREGQLHSLRIPLDKGLTGYRLFLIQQPFQQQLLSVRRLGDLKRYRIGQKSQWVDVRILESAGLQVVGSLDYESLFRMLPAGRFDLLSRGVNEIYAEWESYRASNPELVIEKHLLLYYPLPRYFFFAPTDDGARLARRVKEGIALLRKTGEFDRLYTAYKRDVLAGLDLKGRRVIRLPNPTLPATTPLDKTAWWDSLQAELHEKSGAH